MTFFPDIPNVPGVPPIPRDPFSVIPTVPFLLADSVAFLTGLAGGPQWGVFFNGVPVLFPDNTISFDFKQDWSISTYPVEQGAFASYDKVNSPFEVQIRISKSGSQAVLAAFILLVETVTNSIGLFQVVTPNRIYNNCNCSHSNYRRTAQSGVSLVTFDLWFLEIRETAAAAFSNTAAPSGADPVQGGVVGALPASQTQQAIGIN